MNNNELIKMSKQDLIDLVYKTSIILYKNHKINHYVNTFDENIIELKGGVRKVNITTMTTQKGLAFMFKVLGLTQNNAA